MEREYHRDNIGRFAHDNTISAVSRRADGGTDAHTHPAGRHTPHRISPTEFDNTTAPGQRLYRGVKSAAGGDWTMAGGLGQGDYGPGIYLGRQIATAQNYAQTHGNDTGGRVLRATINPGARVQAPPRRVERGGSKAIDAWARDNKVDVIDLGGYQVVRNPGALTFDERAYTLDESVVLDQIAGGYPLDHLGPEYDAAIAALGYRR